MITTESAINLAAAIVKTAVDDYYNACLYGHRSDDCQKEALRLEDWFKSEWCNVLTMQQGDAVYRVAMNTVKVEWAERFASLYPKRDDTYTNIKKFKCLNDWLQSPWSERFFTDTDGRFSEEIRQKTFHDAIQKGEEHVEEILRKKAIHNVEHKTETGWEVIAKRKSYYMARKIMARAFSKQEDEPIENWRVVRIEKEEGEK